MDIVVFRHGIALDRDEAATAGCTDAQRPLTDQGRHRTRAAAAGLRIVLPDVSLIAASPLLRAQQTAEILAAQMGQPPLLECGALAPGGGVAAVDDWLGEYPDVPAAALVGHEPDLSAWVARACAGDRRPNLELKKAGACLVSFPGPPAPGAGTLRWLLTPRQLRALG